MSRINILDSETINKIAAGEVIERPKAVVKELVENSIDSGATAITVDIQDGGKKHIRITDDGCGIEKDDIRLAFQRHCTSKLKDADQLSIVRTLGFRGEALSSIAAIARVELMTKKKDEILGCRYIIEGGKEVLFDEVGVPEGTTVVVKDMFYNTPARREFLKSVNTEASYISDIVEKFALSHPEISFKYYVNGKLKISTSGNGNIKDVVYGIYGKEVANSLNKVSGSFGNFSIDGYITSPLLAKNSRNGEIYFVNGRYVKNFAVNNAVEAGYHGRLMQGKFPLVFLYLDISPDMINVNIHPTKMEVRFNNEQEIANFITDAIRSTLLKTDITPSIKEMDNAKYNYDEKENSIETVVDDVKKYDNFEPFEKGFKYKYEKEIGEKREEYDSVENKVEQINFFDIQTEEKLKNIKIIGQAFNTYWIFEYDNTMFIMDQHAAHEKVLFEKNLNEYKSKKILSQELAVPITLHLTHLEEQALLDNIQAFKSLGFEIEDYGNRTYIVRTLPYNLYKICKAELLISLLDDMINEKSIENNEIIYIKLATMACKAAVKGNNKLAISEVESLVQQLMKLENPYQCPHGRPTVIRMTKKEIEKIFARII